MVGFVIHCTRTNSMPTATRSQSRRKENPSSAEHWRASGRPVGVSVGLNAGCLLHRFLMDHLVLPLYVSQQRQSFLLLPPVDARPSYGGACADNTALRGRRSPKGKSQLTFVVPEMCVPKGTFVTVVLSLICAIISLTLSVGCSIGFTGGSSSICVQKMSL